MTTNGGSAEIGTINGGTADGGPGLVYDENVVTTLAGGTGNDTINGDAGPDGIVGTGDDPFELDPNSTNTQSIVLRGSLTDVFDIKGTNFATIENGTGGEIVNTSIGTVDVLEGTTLGVAKSSIRSGMATEGVAVADNPGTSEVEGNTFPFNSAKNAIVINAGDEATARRRQSPRHAVHRQRDDPRTGAEHHRQLRQQGSQRRLRGHRRRHLRQGTDSQCADRRRIAAQRHGQQWNRGHLLRRRGAIGHHRAGTY